MASNLIVARGGVEYVPPISLAFWRWTLVFIILSLIAFKITPGALSPPAPSPVRLLVKLVNGAELIGRVEDEDPNWIRIDEPLELRTVTKETQYGPRDDSSLAPWIMFANQKSFAIPRDKVLTITSISKE